MKANTIFRITLMAVAILVAVGCSKSFKPEPPIPALDPKFTELTVDPTKDNAYELDNGTQITIKANSLLNANGQLLTQPVKLNYRQFDDGVSIFLAGMPMKFKAAGEDKILQTGGMFEIRGDVDGKPISVDSQKPITITIGSNYTDTRMGFFKLDDKTGEWDLVDIPTSRVNPDIDSLKNRLNSMKQQNLYVFDYGRMADIFLGDDYTKIQAANMKELKEKMKLYGMNTFGINNLRDDIYYQGNRYANGELVWKADKVLEIPEWVKSGRYSSKNPATGEYEAYYDFKCIDKATNRYIFSARDYELNQKWSCQIEIVSHLRHIFKFGLDAILAQQKSVMAEIEAIEAKLHKARLIEYTVEINQMGVFNCDKPILFSPMRPDVTIAINGKAVDSDNITKLAIFNHNLSSVSYANTTKSVAFFKGINKVMVVTKDGEFGLLTGAQFTKMAIDTTANIKTLHLDLKKVDVKDEAMLREMLVE